MLNIGKFVNNEKPKKTIFAQNNQVIQGMLNKKTETYVGTLSIFNEDITK